jgi:hypothetical protein
MKLNMGSTGFRHSNIIITTLDPEKICGETPNSMRAFHALKAYHI